MTDDEPRTASRSRDRSSWRTMVAWVQLVGVPVFIVFGMVGSEHGLAILVAFWSMAALALAGSILLLRRKRLGWTVSLAVQGVSATVDAIAVVFAFNAWSATMGLVHIALLTALILSRDA